MQNVIDNEAFLEEGDRDHTATLLGDGFATDLRAKELQVRASLAVCPLYYRTGAKH